MGVGIEFDWDESNTAHIARHGVTPEMAEQAMSGEPLFLHMEERHGERRDAFLGLVGNEAIYFIVTTPRNGKVRIVTAFKANQKLREAWKIART